MAANRCLLAGIILSLLGSLAGLCSLLWLNRLETRMSRMTPIAVLDRASVLRALPPDASRENRERVMSALNATAHSLSDAGYLVLDSGWVIAAPEEVYVRSEP